MQEEYSLIILAGGHSSRMGTDKAELTYNGKTFLQWQIEKGRALGITDILVSGERETPEGVRAVPDRVKDCGPLGGLDACLRETRNRKSLVLSVDMPFIPLEQLRELIKADEMSPEPVTITRSEDGAQPLVGVYDRCVLPIIEEQLSLAVYRVFGVLNRTGYHEFVPLTDSFFYSNINTQKEYRIVLAKLLKL